MLVNAGKVAFARTGISVYNRNYDKSLQGQVLGLGFDMACSDVWKPLVVHRGELADTPAFTSGTGTVLHTVNTEAGWSGSPLVRIVGGSAVITAVHIAAVPGPAAFNVAVSASMVERMVRCHDNDFVATWNCPFRDMIFRVDGEDEQVLYVCDEKSTRSKMKTQVKRAKRASAGKARGKQTGAPKRNKRKGDAGWSQHVKGKNKNIGASRMSSANYDKLKQAASLNGGGPQQMEAVRKTYGKLMRLQGDIDRLRHQTIEDPDDNDAQEGTREIGTDSRSHHQKFCS